MKRFLDKVHCVAMDISMVTKLLCLLLWIVIIIMDKIIYPFFIIIKNMSRVTELVIDLLIIWSRMCELNL